MNDDPLAIVVCSPQQEKAVRKWSGYTPGYYVRLGQFVCDPKNGHLTMSRSMQICATWRSHFAYRLAQELGCGLQPPSMVRMP